MTPPTVSDIPFVLIAGSLLYIVGRTVWHLGSAAEAYAKWRRER